LKKLNVAIIGQGRSGRDIHGKFFMSPANTHYNIVAAVDEIADRRYTALTEYGCDVYADYRSLFNRDDIDLVVNATYSNFHYPITLDLLNHGFNVVVEKPFAGRVTECDDMINAAKKNNVMLSIFQQSHFAPYFKRMREIIDSGVLGRIVQVSVRFNGFSRRWDWQTTQLRYGGSMLNTGPHPFEQILTLMDYDGMPQIMSKLDCVNTFGDAEDYVKVLMTAPGRPMFDIEISSCDAYSSYTYKVMGSRGSLITDTRTVKYKYYKDEEAPEQKLTLEPLRNAEGKPAYCSEKLTWHEFEDDLSGSVFTSAVQEYYDMIFNHLTAGGELVIKPEKIRQLIAVMEKIHADNPLPKKH